MIYNIGGFLAFLKSQEFRDKLAIEKDKFQKVKAWLERGYYGECQDRQQWLSQYPCQEKDPIFLLYDEETTTDTGLRDLCMECKDIYVVRDKYGRADEVRLFCLNDRVVLGMLSDFDRKEVVDCHISKNYGLSLKEVNVSGLSKSLTLEIKDDPQLKSFFNL